MAAAPSPPGAEAELELEVPVQALEGESPEDVGERLDIDPDVVGVVDPAEPSAPPIERDAPIPPGSAVTVLIPRDRGVEALTAQDLQVVTWPSTVAAGLEASGEADGCEVTLEGDGTGDVVVYGQDGGSAGWSEVGRIGDGEDLQLAELAPGAHAFFTRGSGGDSAPVGVTTPRRCGEAVGWTGDVTIVDGIIRSPGGNAVFLYLSVDGQPWTRVPAAQEEYLGLKPVDSIADRLPALSGRKLSVELWKWGEFPTKIGSGRLVVPEGVPLAQIVGEPGAVTLKHTTSAATRDALRSSDQELSFTWTAASPQVDEVMWQVLADTPDPRDTDLNPVGLLGAGISEVSTTASDGQGSGTFTIDTGDIARRDSGSDAGASLAPTGAGTMTPVDAALTDRTIGSLGSGTFTSTLAEASVEAGEKLATYLALPGPGETIWIRVVTNPDGPGAPSGSASTPVALPIPQSVATGSIDFTVDSLDVDLGRAPNPELFSCVDVVVPWPEEAPWSNGSGRGYWQGLRTLDDNSMFPGTPDYELGRQATASHFYPTSKTYCPSDFPPDEECDAWYCDVYYGVADFAEAAVGVITQLYDIAAYMYNTVIDEVVWVIGELNLGCQVLGELEEEAVEYCKMGSRWIASAAVTVVLSFFGLPARLPRKEALSDIAEGELGTLAVEIMKYYGVPCNEIESSPEMATAVKKLAEGGGAGADDAQVAKELAENPCLAMANAVISQVRGQVQAAAQQGVASATGLPYFGAIPGFEFRVSPESVPEAATVTMTAHPALADADGTGAVCLAEVRDPAFKLEKGPGPYDWRKLSLDEQAPIDGRGAWSGTVDLPVLATPQQIVALQGLSVPVEVRSRHPSVCRFEKAFATGTVDPPVPKGG